MYVQAIGSHVERQKPNISGSAAFGKWPLLRLRGGGVIKYMSGL
jgi:hypothetical protein